MNPISKYRKNAGLTQVQLAQLCLVCPDSVRRWEKDEREPRASELGRLLKVLDCDIGDLFPDERGKPAA